MSWVIERSQHKGSCFVVLLMIANHAHADGNGAWAGYETLAREARITVRQVLNIIPVLERSQELKVERGAGPHGTNLYTVNMKQLTIGMEKISNRKTASANFHRTVLNQKQEPAPCSPPKMGDKSSASVEKPSYFHHHGTWFEVYMRRRSRLFSTRDVESLAGAHAEDVLARIRANGFCARIVPVDEVASWPENPGIQETNVVTGEGRA